MISTSKLQSWTFQQNPYLVRMLTLLFLAKEAQKIVAVI